jgi:hypothetical protein
MELEGVGFEDVYCVHPAQDRVRLKRYSNSGFMKFEEFLG